MNFGPKGACLALAACLMLGGCLDGKSDDDVWYGYYYDDLRLNAEGAVSRPYQSAKECRTAMQDYTLEAKVTSGFACARGCAAPKDGVIANCREVVR